jgi:hypothetical protein
VGSDTSLPIIDAKARRNAAIPKRANHRVTESTEKNTEKKRQKEQKRAAIPNDLFFFVSLRSL